MAPYSVPVFCFAWIEIFNFENGHILNKFISISRKKCLMIWLKYCRLKCQILFQWNYLSDFKYIPYLNQPYLLFHLAWIAVRCHKLSHWFPLENHIANYLIGLHCDNIESYIYDFLFPCAFATQSSLDPHSLFWKNAFSPANFFMRDIYPQTVLSSWKQTYDQKKFLKGVEMKGILILHMKHNSWVERTNYHFHMDLIYLYQNKHHHFFG